MCPCSKQEVLSGIRASCSTGCRLFLVHGDGSAVEFLSSQTVEELLHQAHSDPAAALLKEPLPDCPGSQFCCPEPFLKSCKEALIGPRLRLFQMSLVSPF